MITSAPTKIDPVMMLRPGTGHLFQPNRLATRGPSIESRNGKMSSRMITTVPMPIEKMNSLPSFRNWNRNRKYQSGRGMVTARGSADGSS